MLGAHLLCELHKTQAATAQEPKATSASPKPPSASFTSSSSAPASGKPQATGTGISSVAPASSASARGRPDQDAVPASLWAPYIEQLPRSYTTFAYFAPDEARDLQVRVPWVRKTRQYHMMQSL